MRPTTAVADPDVSSLPAVGAVSDAVEQAAVLSVLHDEQRSAPQDSAAQAEPFEEVSTTRQKSPLEIIIHVHMCLDAEKSLMSRLP